MKSVGKISAYCICLVLICLSVLLCAGCASNGNNASPETAAYTSGLSGETGKTAVPAYETQEADETSDQSEVKSETADNSSALPSATPNNATEMLEISKQITEQSMGFFDGEWEGLNYKFSFTSKDCAFQSLNKTTGVVSKGTYLSTTEDDMEYKLYLIFGEKMEKYTAWKYGDTGSVAIIPLTDGGISDTIWRVQ